MRIFNDTAKCARDRFRRAATCVAGLILLLGGAWTHAVELSPASASDVWLHLKAPGLESVTPTFARGEKDFIIYERGDWRVPGKQWPRARIYFLRMSDLLHGNYMLLRGPGLADIVTRQFAGRDVELQGTGTAINDFDELEYQRFMLDGCVPCIYIRQGRNTSGEALDVIGPGDPIGDLKLVGWYCTDPDSTNAEAALAGFVNGIGIKGYAEPETPSESSELKTRRR